MESNPVVMKKKGISPVWTLPLIALGICCWILYSSIQNAGISIAIYFDDASGITPGKTQVISRGIPIGTVIKLIPDLSNRRIKTVVKMEKPVEDQLVEDTLFWVVRPEISAASVQGLDTLLSGSYIGIQPGSSLVATRNFIGKSAPPPISEDTPGLHIKLRAEELGSIQNSSGIYFRNISIGTVTKSSLEEDNGAILINLFIQPEYAHLVREGSRFYNASGLSISGKLTNLKVRVESLASLLKGGIVLHTPEELATTKQVKNGHIFPLYKDLESARYGVKMTLQLASSMGITEGETQVIYRGLVAGVVEKITFNNDERHTVTANIMLDPRAERILRAGTQFWIVKPRIETDGVKNLSTLISGPYITFIPGPGPYQDHFEILPEVPPQKPLRLGSELVLTAQQSFSIKKGAPVTYKAKKVGEVLDVELDDTFSNFEILIFIYEQYEMLVGPNSVFWSESGVALDASISGIHLKSQSLTSILSGGISFLTPQSSGPLPGDADHDVVFLLHENYEQAVKATPALQPQGYHFRLATSHPERLKVGAPILYKNIQVGKVTDFHLANDNRTVFIDCFVEKQYEKSVNSTSRFFDVSGVTLEGSLSGVSMHTASLETIVAGGIEYMTPDLSAPKKKQGNYQLYASKRAALNVDHVPVKVRFQDCGNLQPGSLVKYKGVKIGNVVDLHFDEGLKQIEVDLLIRKKAQSFFRQNTKIWLENAQVSFSGIKNLKTVLFGSYINVLPGSGDPKRSFTALSVPPVTPAEITGGLEVTLTSKHLGSLKINSPIYYRQIKVGKVVQFSLSDNFQHVLIDINIAEKYAALVRENTKFWAVSGARIEGGLFSGVSVSMESMEALLTGGIALATPENSMMGEQVVSHHRFTLFDKGEKEWLDWQPDITLVKQEVVNKPGI